MNKFKVIRTSNYNLDTISDTLVKDNLTFSEAQALVDSLDEQVNADSMYAYLAIPQDRPLKVADLS